MYFEFKVIIHFPIGKSKSGHHTAVSALSVSAWPRDKVPVELKKAVIQAMQLNQNPFIGLVLQSIIDERVPAPAEFEYGDM